MSGRERRLSGASANSTQSNVAGGRGRSRGYDASSYGSSREREPHRSGNYYEKRAGYSSSTSVSRSNSTASGRKREDSEAWGAKPVVGSKLEMDADPPITYVAAGTAPVIPNNFRHGSPSVAVKKPMGYVAQPLRVFDERSVQQRESEEKPRERERERERRDVGNSGGGGKKSHGDVPSMTRGANNTSTSAFFHHPHQNMENESTRSALMALNFFHNLQQQCVAQQKLASGVSNGAREGSEENGAGGETAAASTKQPSAPAPLDMSTGVDALLAAGLLNPADDKAQQQRNQQQLQQQIQALAMSTSASHWWHQQQNYSQCSSSIAWSSSGGSGGPSSLYSLDGLLTPPASSSVTCTDEDEQVPIGVRGKRRGGRNRAKNRRGGGGRAADCASSSSSSSGCEEAAREAEEVASAVFGQFERVLARLRSQQAAMVRIVGIKRCWAVPHPADYINIFVENVHAYLVFLKTYYPGVLGRQIRDPNGSGPSREMAANEEFLMHNLPLMIQHLMQQHVQLPIGAAGGGVPTGGVNQHNQHSTPGEEINQRGACARQEVQQQQQHSHSASHSQQTHSHQQHMQQQQQQQWPSIGSSSSSTHASQPRVTAAHAHIAAAQRKMGSQSERKNEQSMRDAQSMRQEKGVEKRRQVTPSPQQINMVAKADREVETTVAAAVANESSSGNGRTGNGESGYQSESSPPLSLDASNYQTSRDVSNYPVASSKVLEKERKKSGSKEESKPQQPQQQTPASPRSQPPRAPPAGPPRNGAQFQVSEMDVLSEEIWHYHNSVTQTEITLNRKLHLRDMLYYSICPVFPMCGLYVVGSSLNGFGNNSSDMDLCLMITNKDLDQKTDAVVVLNMIIQTLQSVEWVAHQQLILAKVPIVRIKFTAPFADITVDLNANNSVAIKNTHLLCYYSSFDWRVRPLVSVVKEWAKRKGINDANRSSFTSYSLVLMVIHYLQCGADPVVLPSLQAMYQKRFSNKCDVRSLNVSVPLTPPSADEWQFNEKATLGELLIGFLDYYAHKFDYDRDAISVRQGRRVERAVVARARPASMQQAQQTQQGGHAGTANWRSQWRCVCIEEPFTLSNTAHSIYDEMVFAAIKGAFREAAEQLDSTRDLRALLDCRPINVHAPSGSALVFATCGGAGRAAEAAALSKTTSGSASSLNTARSDASCDSSVSGEEERPEKRTSMTRRPASQAQAQPHRKAPIAQQVPR